MDGPDGLILREERDADAATVRALIAAAFAPMPFSRGTEGAIVAALRREGAVALALVAERAGELLGQAVFSPATVGGKPTGWHALGPVAVAPGWQRRGIGGRLIRNGLERMAAAGSEGCIVLGDPDYYRRFGFRVAPEFAPPGVPREFFMVLPFGERMPDGAVAFHPAFED